MFFFFASNQTWGIDAGEVVLAQELLQTSLTTFGSQDPLGLLDDVWTSERAETYRPLQPLHWESFWDVGKYSMEHMGYMPKKWDPLVMTNSLLLKTAIDISRFFP